MVVEDDEGAECTRDDRDVGSCFATLFVVYWPEPSDDTILKNIIF
jgi:hypothetical protein